MTQLREQCLWEHITAKPTHTVALASAVKADVCVIGAGITGLCAAIHLLEQGQRVVLLEAGEIGTGGSGRNVGLVNAGTWIPPDDVESTLGAECGGRLNSLLGGAPAQVFALIERYGIQCQAHNDGNLHMAHNASGVADLQSRCEQWQRRGADVELLTGSECVDYCGTDRVEAALLDRRAGTINPMAYTRGLGAVVQRLGGQVFQHSAVQHLQRQGADWRVRTANGEVSAAKVVISTGAYTEGDWSKLQGQFFRGYYYQVASRPLEGAEADQVLKHGQGSWDTRMVLSSIRRDDDGRLLLGSMGRVDNKPSGFIRAWADRIQRHYFAPLGKVQWEMHWTGCIDFTPDHLLRVFEPAPGLVSVTGYNGRGNTTGTVVGKALAEFMLRGEAAALPLPFCTAGPMAAPRLRTALYETGFSLYHAGQCLRVIL